MNAQKNFDVSACASFCALTHVKGTANKYLENTSIPVRTYLYVDDWNGPTISICIISPGNDCREETGCKNALRALFAIAFC